ncbi:MAG TPA: phasin family protein [Casimicrobiaceae bacterium]|jgi:hypothetical protein|nr:phasin family protein [Casimicrobiaceae bacterium]
MATRKSPASRTSARRASPRGTTARTAKSAKTAKTAAKSAQRRTRARAAPRGAAHAAGAVPDFAALARGARLMSPEQAIALYKSNARMALDVINAALESSARMRKLQLAGVEEIREFGERQARNVSGAKSPDALMAAGQGAARDAIEHAMGYWSQMFDLIVEIQKRLFTLIEAQMGDVPGVKEARAAMAMMPDMSQAQNVIRALQGVVSSSSGAVEQMQKVIADLARMGGLRRS